MELDDVEDGLTAYAADVLTVTRTPGASVAVRVGDESRAWAFGVANAATAEPMTPGHTFRMGSMSKIVVGAVAVRLADEGMLTLDDPVAPFLAPTHADFPRAVTMRHLLSHTSGLAGDSFAMAREHPPPLGAYLTALLASGRQPEYRNARPLWEGAPGEAKIRYSSAGIALAAWICELAGGRPFEQQAGALFDEAGLEDTVLAPPWREPERLVARLAQGHLTWGDTWVPGPRLYAATWPSTGMISTPADQVRWLVALPAVLGASGYGDMTRAVAAFTIAGDPDEVSVGLGMQMQETGPGGRRVGHGGAWPAGAWSDVRTFADDVTICVSVNSWDQIRYMNAPPRYAYGMLMEHVRRAIATGGARRTGSRPGPARTAFAAGLLTGERLAMFGVSSSPSQIAQLAAGATSVAGTALSPTERDALRDGLERAGRPMDPQQARGLVEDGPLTPEQWGIECLRAGAGQPSVRVPFPSFAEPATPGPGSPLQAHDEATAEDETHE